MNPVAVAPKAFDADTVAFSYGEIPPPPWDCPTCGSEVRGLALTTAGLVCSLCFQLIRMGDPDFPTLDAVLA